MYIFDGQLQSENEEKELAQEVEKIKTLGGEVAVAAVLFKEDSGSRLYSSRKQQAAERVGIAYHLHEFSLSEDPQNIIAAIRKLNSQPLTGIIIQKPTRRVWESYSGWVGESQNFSEWWRSLYQEVAIEKDVDGLHPETIKSIQDGTWQEKGRVLPATCRAVLKVLDHPELKNILNKDSKYLIIGISDLLGIPLNYFLGQQGKNVEMIGRKEFNHRLKSGQKLFDVDVVISATGQPNLITGEMIRDGVVLIDVGEPEPDVNRLSVEPKASFLTPVPGGIGPLSVVSLLQNSLTLWYNSHSVSNK